MNYKVLLGASLAALAAMAAEPTTLPKGWLKTGQPPAAQSCEASADTTVTSKGSRSLALRCDKNDAGFVTVMQQFDAQDFRGQRVRFAATVRVESVEQWGGLWMRIDGDKTPAIAFDNMQSRPIKGTKNWTRYEVVLDVADNASGIAFGMLLNGKGRMWMDDIQLEAVRTNVPTTGNYAPIGSRPTNLDLSQ